MTDEPLADAPAQQAPHNYPVDPPAEQQAAHEAAEQHKADDAAHEADAKPVDESPEAKEAAEAEAKAKADAEKAEADKAHRAEHGLTGSENGDPAGTAFGARIEAAKWEHRNQGHDDTMQLLDDMLAAMQRLEAKASGAA